MSFFKVKIELPPFVEEEVEAETADEAEGVALENFWLCLVEAAETGKVSPTMKPKVTREWVR